MWHLNPRLARQTSQTPETQTLQTSTQMLQKSNTDIAARQGESCFVHEHETIRDWLTLSDKSSSDGYGDEKACSPPKQGEAKQLQIDVGCSFCQTHCHNCWHLHCSRTLCARNEVRQKVSPKQGEAKPLQVDMGCSHCRNCWHLHCSQADA